MVEFRKFNDFVETGGIMKSIWNTWSRLSLIQQICIGLVIGIFLGVAFPKATGIGLFGTLFVSALKAVAPILVLVLIVNAICHHETGKKTNIKNIIGLYLVGTFAGGAMAVIVARLFPVKLVLNGVDAADTASAPTDLVTVLTNLLTNLVANPIHALATLSISIDPETLSASTSVSPNFLGILVWACLLGLCLIKARQSTKDMIEDLANSISQIVRWVIKFAPLGVMGLIYTAISTTGLSVLVSYGQIILLLVGIMLLDALVLNPIIVFTQIRQNPYPLVLRCLKDSGITAFFTRSSAANIPVNMQLCEDLGLDKDTYAISIPLGATINMAGAAITISTLTMCCCFTIGHQVPLGFAIILSVLSALSACGASGVPGGSLLLIPLACSLFGIPGDIAAQVIGVGFIVAVVQDSMETAINSSTDALFTATADFKRQKKEGKTIKVSILG